MGSHFQEGNHHLLLTTEIPSAHLCQPVSQGNFSSSSHETELENVGVPTDPELSELSQGKQESGIWGTGCAVSGSSGEKQAFEVDIKKKAAGLSKGQSRPPEQQSGLIYEKRSPFKETETEDLRNHRIAVKGLKIRFSLGSKLTIKKSLRESGARSSSAWLAPAEGTLSSPEEAPGCHVLPNSGVLVQKPVGEAWEPADSSCTDTDEDGELIQRVRSRSFNSRELGLLFVFSVSSCAAQLSLV